jgi:hypothetical protein
MFEYTQEDIERFYDHITIITKDTNKGCWDIDYARVKGGYTRFTTVSKIKGQQTTASNRFMYLIHHPDEEEKMIDLEVCHKCDNPWCVNPDHLWLGTNQDNMTDKVNKNRQSKLKGSKNGMAILNEDFVEEILNNVLNGKIIKIPEIAYKYQISKSTIDQIINNKKWTHITKKYDMIKIKTIIDENSHTLSYDDIRDIRNRLENGELQKNIANNYNVSIPLISNIKNNNIYSHVI